MSGRCFKNARKHGGQGLILLAVCAALLAGCSRAVDSSTPEVTKPAVVGSAPREGSQETDPARQSLRAAAAWVWSQQAADGGWHSRTYRLLGSGQGLTPLVLHALQGVLPQCYTPDTLQLGRALKFVRGHVNAQGVIGLDDPEVPEYPNYSTALAVLCLLHSGEPRDAPRIKQMAAYLALEQFSPQRGFGPEHLAFGGWGFGGPLPLGGSPGHMDIAHTRHVLEALRAAGPIDVETCHRAEAFLGLMQRRTDEHRPHPSEAGEPRPRGWQPPYDGGFFFSPIVLAANKGREGVYKGQPYFRSYASATCEGVLALLAVGVPVNDDRVQQAANWLREHPRLEYPEGIPDDQPEPWGDSIFYYHLAVRAQAYAALNWPGPWRREVAKLLTERQEPDGSFRNRQSALMKEDDPMLATALAILALNECVPH